MSKKIIVVGGGAAGMLAAYFAAAAGNKVTLLEKNEKLGKKIYITGKGRCNLTNACDVEELFLNVKSNSKYQSCAMRKSLIQRQMKKLVIKSLVIKSLVIKSLN